MIIRKMSIIRMNYINRKKFYEQKKSVEIKLWSIGIKWATKLQKKLLEFYL